MKQIQGTFHVRWEAEPVPGPPGVVYRLRPSSTQIKRKKDGNCSPSNISCERIVKIGNEPQQISSDGVLYYRFSNGQRTPYTSELAVPRGAEWLEFDWVIANASVDKVTVPVIEEAKDGTNAFVVDADDEVIPVAVINAGTAYGQSQYVTINAFYGSTPVTLKEGEYTATPSNSNLFSVSKSANRITIDVKQGKSWIGIKKETVNIVVSHAYGRRELAISLYPTFPGKDSLIYTLQTSHSAFSFSRNDNGGLVGSFSLELSVVKHSGNTREEHKSLPLPSNLKIYGGFDSTGNTIELKSLTQSVNASNAAGHWCYLVELWNGDRTVSGSKKLDQETIPIVADGKKGGSGKPGDTPCIFDTANQMIAVAVDKNGYAIEGQKWNTDLRYYYGNETGTPTVVSTNPETCFQYIGISDTVLTAQRNSNYYWGKSDKRTCSYKVKYKNFEGVIRFTFYPVFPGEDGESPTIYQLKPSPDALKFDRDPSSGALYGYYVLTAKVVRTKGAVSDDVTASIAKLGLTVTAAYDGYGGKALGDGLTVNSSQADISRFVGLELKLNGEVVDREAVPIIKDGYKGEPGGDGPIGLDGCSVRTTEWAKNVEYLNETSSTKRGMRYLDQVTVSELNKNEYRLFKCKKSHTSTAANMPPNAEYWTELNNTQPMYTPLLVAANAVMRFGQANQFYIVDQDGKIVAKYGGGNYPILVGDVEKAIQGNTHESVIGNCKFVVDKYGRTWMKDCHVEGLIKADRGYFRGFIRKGITQIKSGNMADYIVKRPEAEGGDYIDFNKLSPIIYLQGTFQEMSICRLPSFDYQFGTYTPNLINEARSYIGIDFLVYNYSGISMPVTGHLTDKANEDSGAYHSISIDPRTMAHFTCKVRIKNGRENVYWLEERIPI